MCAKDCGWQLGKEEGRSGAGLDCRNDIRNGERENRHLEIVGSMAGGLFMGESFDVFIVSGRAAYLPLSTRAHS